MSINPTARLTDPVILNKDLEHTNSAKMIFSKILNTESNLPITNNYASQRYLTMGAQKQIPVTKLKFKGKRRISNLNLTTGMSSSLSTPEDVRDSRPTTGLKYLRRKI